MNRGTPEFDAAEYRVKISHFTKQGFDINGVIHIGANDGYEMQWYRQLGIQHILGFEPFFPAIQRFKEKYGDSIPLVEGALSDKDGEYILYQYGDDGQGSSLYKPIAESAQVVAHWGIDQFDGPDKGPKSKTLVKVYRFD